MNNFDNHRTLILNATYQPLSIASAKRSISLLLSNKINVIKKSNLELRSESSTITIPKVAALKVETLLGTGAEIGDRTIVETFDISCTFVANIFFNKVANLVKSFKYFFYHSLLPFLKRYKTCCILP